MSAFWTRIEWLVEKMKIVGAACLVGMMLLTCADVIGRLFGHPIFGNTNHDINANDEIWSFLSKHELIIGPDAMESTSWGRIKSLFK